MKALTPAIVVASAVQVVGRSDGGLTRIWRKVGRVPVGNVVIAA